MISRPAAGLVFRVGHELAPGVAPVSLEFLGSVIRASDGKFITARRYPSPTLYYTVYSQNSV
jgi:hypothetical protein